MLQKSANQKAKSDYTPGEFGKSKKKFDSKKFGDPVDEYLYTNEDGNPLYYNCRFESNGGEKEFLQRKPERKPDGKWDWSIVGVQRVPYHLPKLIEADTVLFVEGEKDVHTAENLGFIATTTSSSTSWKPEIAKWFKGKNVILIPDNDVPGRKYMEKVALDICEDVKSLKWLELPHNGQEGFDLTDWYKRSYNPEEPNYDEVWETSDLTSFKVQFTCHRRMAPTYRPLGAPLSAEEIISMKLSEPRWAVSEIIPEGLTILAGKPKFGKSMLAMNIGLSITTGKEVMGHVKADSGTVIYLAFEDPPRRLKHRLMKMLNGKPAPSNLIFYESWPKKGDGCLRKIETEVKKRKDVRLIIIDTLVNIRPSTTSKNEMYKKDYEDLIDLKRLADQYQISIVVVHHLRKAKGDEDVFDEISGTLGLTGAADGILVGVRQSKGHIDGELHCRGRDMADVTFSLKFEKDTYWWNIVGSPGETLSTEQLQCLSDAIPYDKPKSRKDIIDETGLDEQYVDNTLSEWRKDDKIERVSRGMYRKVTII